MRGLLCEVRSRSATWPLLYVDPCVATAADVRLVAGKRTRRHGSEHSEVSARSSDQDADSVFFSERFLCSLQVLCANHVTG